MNANTQLEVAIVKAEEKGTVLITQVEGQKKIAESQIKAEVVESVNRAKAAAKAQMKDTDEKAGVFAIEAESRLLAT